MSTTFREATPGDAAAVAALYAGAVEAGGRGHYDDDQRAAWAGADVARPLRSDGRDPGRAVVAERGGRVVGFGRLGGAGTEVTAVYVHPDCAREGIGRALLARLEAAVRAADREIVAVTASLNAVGFYRRAGYERVRRVAHAVDGVELPGVRMRKRLTGAGAKEEA